MSSTFLRRILWYSVGDRFPGFSMLGVNDTDAIVDARHITKRVDSNVLLSKRLYFYLSNRDCRYGLNLVHDADVIGVSADNEFCKLAWKKQNNDIQHIQHILCADSGLKLGYTLGIVDEDNGVHYRATFIIDPEGVIQHVSVNALDTGRNADEILRTLQALKAGGLTGCSWQPGDDFVA